MTDLPDDRKEAVRHVAQYLRRYKRPQTQLFLILFLTAAIGVLLSYIQLRIGLSHMWVRYPVAAFLAYLAFLFTLRLWAEHQLNRPELASDLSRHAAKPDENNKRKPRLPLTLFDLLEMLVWIDDAPVFLLILIGLIMVAAVVVILIAAPMLLAEVLLDGLLVTGLWHRIKHRGAIESIGGALRTTWIPAAIVIFGLGLIGFLLEKIEPSAMSIGDLIRF